jgi:hypothetical protein
VNPRMRDLRHWARITRNSEVAPKPDHFRIGHYTGPIPTSERYCFRERVEAKRKRSAGTETSIRRLKARGVVLNSLLQ